ncbi:n(6)-adenine-specific methyltransferase METTL4 [Nephila pilipes]|uniref:N(6)-adenine-specific methyltransferase METTL4 n=1 Tax=Nephila pilipes TaxID=299642 RepID=A0A8X6UQ03_NEPPI|nr:n(6)-adenine-specific methyltransferase METTL4 [Nephila pilipes]
MHTLKKEDKKAKKRAKNRSAKLQTNSLENEIVIKKSTSLIQAARDFNLLKSHHISSSEWFENNYEAIKAAKEVCNLSLDVSVPSEYYNRNNESTIVIFGSEKYVLPAKSSFHLCDINNIMNLKGTKYDLIVLDPPWENKSVRRNKKYKTLDCDSLINLPIETICNPGCLIVVWVTNNQRQLNFVKEKLFPKWKVVNHVMWHWFKITLGGHFIHSGDWHHKKPYENLLLGYVSSDFENKNFVTEVEIEPHKVILCVPSSIHSHKPPLTEILKPYISENANCLEIFARYLLPKWTSLGNEVVKLQNIKLFETIS